jgi:translation initiation factor 2B subunit (eIF-2B alpha/beta/delta family)
MKKEEKISERFDEIIRQIKDVKIQGANNIAISGIEAALLRSDKESIKKIISARPTEPLLQNSISIITKSKDKSKSAKKLIGYIEKSKSKIGFLGSYLIKDNMNVFSHCHSSTVIEILKYAKKVEKKNFVVYTLEVEPLQQGRKTAEELSRFGIKVVVFPDLAAEQALKSCDVFLFGSDAFLKSGVVNKIGTSLLCEIAREHKIPTYSCGVSLKFAKNVKIENRSGREVWDARNENIMVINPAFDFTKNKLLSGVISELGILKYKDFIRNARKTKLKLSD